MLEVKNLKKNFGKLSVLKGVTFNVKKGEVISIIGPSGCGKSTLLRCINMLEKPSSGKVLFEGIDITDKNVDLPKIREKIGMVFQQFNLFPHLTVLDNIILAPVKLGIMDKKVAIKKACDLLRDTSLIDKKDNYPDELSGGQKQRVAIVRSLIMNPDIILFDEPTSALDPEMVGEVLELIKKVGDTGMTMLVVSHEMNFVKKCASRVLFMDNGKIVIDGFPKDVFENKDNERLREFLNKTNN
ncbi:MAG: amino acid ABC transporter ATP-binding protein [Bacilli bacterium]